MITLEFLSSLTSAEKDDLILRQAEEIVLLKQQVHVLSQQVQELTHQVHILQAAMNNKKTSKNSSAPPSKDQKTNRPDKEKKTRKKRPGPGFSRGLHANPHEIKDIKLQECSCGMPLSDEQKIYQEFDHIDIPSIEVKVTRYRLFRAKCPHCKKRNYAAAPEGFDAYAPFGSGIQHLLLYLRCSHFLSYIRLKSFCSDVLKFDISQGAIANLLKRNKSKVDAKVNEYKRAIRESSIVESDETSARVNGKNWWEWVFHNDDVALHVIRPSRGAQVVKDVLGDHQPDYWCSDLYSAQRGHGKKWQICLAHQLRDCQFAIEEGDTAFSGAMRKLFLKAIDLSKRRHNVKPSTIKSYQQKLDRKLTEILGKTMPLTPSGENLRRRYLKDRDSLFTFFENLALEPTNNRSERSLRTSVIFRKVTNGFRSDWGTDLFAGVRSIVNTGLRNDMNPYQSLKEVLQSN